MTVSYKVLLCVSTPHIKACRGDKSLLDIGEWSFFMICWNISHDYHTVLCEDTPLSEHCTVEAYEGCGDEVPHPIRTWH